VRIAETCERGNESRYFEEKSSKTIRLVSRESNRFYLTERLETRELIGRTTMANCAEITYD